MEAMTRVSRRIGTIIVLALLSGCRGKGDGAAPAPAAAPGTPPPVAGSLRADGVVSALRGAGLPTEGFAALNPVPYGAAVCEEGRVDTIDTLVCEYRDDATLARGKAALLDQWGREGGHTGVALASKLTLLGVFDRARHDPNGKTISRVIDTFRKL
jgi:hypothetical protein